MLEPILLEHCALVVDVAFLRRPQHQGADGIGEARAGNAGALAFQPGRRAVVGGEEHLEWRAILDLRIELAGGAEGDYQLVPGVFLELERDGLDRRGEVGGHGHLHFLGQRAAGKSQASDQCAQGMGHKTTHGATPCCWIDGCQGTSSGQAGLNHV
ncbi:hypothetical protein D9M68_701980 [compost metagenome]